MPIDVFLERDKIESRLKHGMSLFRIALELDEDVCSAIRDYPHCDCIPVARLAVWFADFFKKSYGGDYKKCSWGKNANTPLPVKLWEGALQKLRETQERCDRNHFLAKCWAFDTRNRTQGRTGEGSDVWRCIRKAKNSFQTDGEIRLEGEQKGNWLTLLMASDTIERTDFSLLIQWLATGQVPDELQGCEGEKSWTQLHDACFAAVGTDAWVDWYLFWGPEAGPAQFGAGFDSFPSDEHDQMWRRFHIDGQRCEIPHGYSAFFKPLPLDKAAEVKYSGKTWTTLGKEEGRQDCALKDSVLFPRDSMPFGVFIQHRTGEGDVRRFWWREADNWWDERFSPPKLKRSQNKFLICARDATVLEGLELHCDNPIVIVKKIHEARDQVFEKNEASQETECHAIQVYEVTQRPDNTDSDLILSYQGQSRRIIILGTVPTIEIKGNQDGIELEESDKRIVAFPGQPIQVNVQHARPDQRYCWTAMLDGQKVWTTEGLNVELCFRDVVGVVDWGHDLDAHSWRIDCRDDEGRSITPVCAGILLPDGVRGGVMAGTGCPANWKAEEADDGNSPTQRIANWIEGKKRMRLEHVGGQTKPLHIFIPPKALNWWFECGHYTYRDKDGLWSCGGEQVFNERRIPTISPDELENIFLCVPNLQHFSLEDFPGAYLNHEGYWRARVADLIAGSGAGREYRYSATSGPREWGCHGQSFFRYIPPEPKTPLLCEDANGKLGLFVPENTSQIYDVYGFSDQNPELFKAGRFLGQSHPDTRFLELQSKWEDFCRQTEGYDALLAAFPHREEPGFLNVLATCMELCRLREGQQHAYPPEMLPLVQPMKDWCAVLVHSEHPVLKMNFYTTEQKASLAELRRQWKEQVKALCQSEHCKEVGQWKSLIAGWRACGFIPSLEGIGRELLGMAVEGYLRFPPAPYSRRRNGYTPVEGEWKQFVKWWWHATDAEQNREICERVRKLGYRGRNDTIFSMAQEMQSTLRKYRNDFEIVAATVSDNIVADRNELERKISRLSSVDLVELPNQLFSSLQLNNNIGAEELSLEQGDFAGQFLDGQHPTPQELYRDRILVSDNPGHQLIAKLLERMGLDTNGRMRNVSVGIPTDREWLFCLAAFVILRDTGRQVDDALTSVFKRIFDCAKSGQKNWNNFKKYCLACEVCMNLPQTKRREYHKEIFSGKAAFSDGDDTLLAGSHILHERIVRVHRMTPEPVNILQSVDVEAPESRRLKKVFLNHLENWVSSRAWTSFQSKQEVGDSRPKDVEWALCLAEILCLQFHFPEVHIPAANEGILKTLFEAICEDNALFSKFKSCCWRCNRWAKSINLQETHT